MEQGGPFLVDGVRRKPPKGKQPLRKQKHSTVQEGDLKRQPWPATLLD